MGLDYSCDESENTQAIQDKILDMLGNSFQTAGYISSVIGNHAINPVLQSINTLQRIQDSVNSYLSGNVSNARQTLLDSQRTITMLAANEYQRIQSTAGKCLRDCESTCGNLREGIWTPPQASGQTNVSQPSLQLAKPEPDFFPGGINPYAQYTPGPSPADLQTVCPKPLTLASDRGTPEKPLYFQNVAPPVNCPTRIITLVRDPEKLPTTFGYAKYCNANGEGIVVPSEMIPPANEGWNFIAGSHAPEGPWPDCPLPQNPINPQPETQNGQPYQSQIHIPAACEIDFYTGSVKGNFADDVASFKLAVDRTIQTINPLGIAANAATNAIDATLLFSSAYACENGDASYLQKLRGYYQLASHALGIESPQILRRIEYDINRLCPSIMPTGDQALRDFLSNAIKDESTLKKYVEINGHCWEPWKLKIQSERSKFIPDEIFALERRGICTSQSSNERLRELGYIEPTQWDCLRQLQQFIPGPQDLVRFMVRDVQDDKIVNRFRLDDQFTDKFNGELAKWAKYQAVDTEVMRQFWRAHWRVPELHQLSEMYQRNRRRRYDDKARLTIDDVRAALGQADYLPFWQDKLEILLYRPISQRYIYEVYHYGGVDETQLFEHLCYVGYSDDDARVVTNGFQVRKEDGIFNTRAVHQYTNSYINKSECKKQLQRFKYTNEFIDHSLNTLDLHFHNHRDLRLYKEGLLTYNECRNRLEQFGLLQDNITILLEGVIPDLKFSIALRQLKAMQLSEIDAIHALKDEGVEDSIAGLVVEAVSADIDKDLITSCRNNIKHEFITGKFNRQGAIAALVQFGITLDWANKLTSSWECELKSQGKTVPTNTLCDWFSKGVINPQEFADRLENVGYTKKDATFLVGDCIDRINQKAADKLAKQNQQLRKQLEKSQKDREKAAGQDEKRIENLQRARDKAKAVDDKRRNALMAATAVYDKKSGYGPNDSSEIILGVYNVLKSDFGVDTDTAIAAIQKSLDTIDKSNADQIGVIASTYIESAKLAEVSDDGT